MHQRRTQAEQQFENLPTERQHELKSCRVHQRSAHMLLCVAVAALMTPQSMGCSFRAASSLVPAAHTHSHLLSSLPKPQASAHSMP